MFGMRAAMTMNLENSKEPHARSRYLPPYSNVAEFRARVKIFCSTNVAVNRVQG